MTAIKIRAKISGQTLKIRQLERLRGKTVSIIIYPDDELPPSGKNVSRVPSWLGRYTTDRRLVDDRSSIYPE